MKILVACEFSGVVRDAFAARGHDAWSCDLYPSETLGNHYQCDVTEVLGEPWDMIIAHPSCQYLANSGVHWMDREEGRYAKMVAAAVFFRMFLLHPCKKKCIENPIMHFSALGFVGRNYTQMIHPWQFGHEDMKATCLWLEGLPSLQPTNIVGPPPADADSRRSWQTTLYMRGENKAHDRSRTFLGIAEAMAEQWG